MVPMLLNSGGNGIVAAAGATRRLKMVAAHMVQAAAGSQISTAHPANRRLGLGHRRKLRVLNEKQLGLFWENGFLVVEDLLSLAEVDVLATHTDAIAAGKTANPQDMGYESQIQIEPQVAYKRTGNKDIDTQTLDGLLEVQQTGLVGEKQVLSVRKLSGLVRTDGIMFQHAANDKVVDVIADLLGTQDIKVFGDQLFMKNPHGVGSSIEWHQDSTSWSSIYPRDLVSAWTAIDHATEENGCLEFLPVGTADMSH
eukprot:COSAG05_NODE_1945_length_3798_cov_3.151122_2_plen_254_part_00